MSLRTSAVLGARAAGAILLILAVTTTAAAQGGRGGKGRHRSPEPATPAREQAGDEYPLDGSQVLEAIDRGEGGPALAYYERAAAQAEQQGDALRAARAWHAASMVLVRQGRFQKAIQSAERAIQQFKAAGEPRAVLTSGRGRRPIPSWAPRIARSAISPGPAPRSRRDSRSREPTCGGATRTRSRATS